MRLLLIALSAMLVAACAKESTPPPADSAGEAAESSPRSDPVEELVALDLRTEVPPPSLLDPPEEETSASGLKSIIYARGNGRTAEAGDLVAVHYTGWLQDAAADDGKGEKFDSSLDRGEPIMFALGAGRVIKGWDEGIAGMREGGKRTLVIPPDIAYGSKNVGDGLIPPNSTLVFDVELVNVTKQ